jgi:very-short-patch-repair endonuclease
VPIGPYVADFVWRQQRLIVETDGHASHGTRAAFERDAKRDAWLACQGYRVLRFTYRQVTARPAEVTRTLTALLAA